MRKSEPIAVSDFLWMDKFLAILEKIKLISHETSMTSYLRGYSRAAKDIDKHPRRKIRP